MSHGHLFFTFFGPFFRFHTQQPSRQVVVTYVLPSPLRCLSLLVVFHACKPTSTLLLDFPRIVPNWSSRTFGDRKHSRKCRLRNYNTRPRFETQSIHQQTHQQRMDTTHTPAFPMLLEFPRLFRLLSRALECSGTNDKKAD